MIHDQDQARQRTSGTNTELKDTQPQDKKADPEINPKVEREHTGTGVYKRGSSQGKHS